MGQIYAKYVVFSCVLIIPMVYADDYLIARLARFCKSVCSHNEMYLSSFLLCNTPDYKATAQVERTRAMALLTSR